MRANGWDEFLSAQKHPIDWVLAVVLVLGFLWGLTACAPSDQSSSPAPALSAPAAASTPAAGGWSQAESNADDVQEAARFAVQAYAVAQHSRTLYKDVVEAQRQVVAGVNFKLQLQVLHKGAPRTAQATVWHPVHGAYQLSNWVWVD
jgi:Cystatin domain